MSCNHERANVGTTCESISHVNQCAEATDAGPA